MATNKKDRFIKKLDNGSYDNSWIRVNINDKAEITKIIKEQEDLEE